MKKEYQVALVMSPILIMFYLLNCCVGFFASDHAYQFICGVDEWFNSSSVRIDSYGDIVQSQYNHYLQHSGRVIIHFLEQCFVSFWGKPIFNVLNTLTYLLFSYLTIALIEKSLLKNYMAWGAIAILVAFILPAHASLYQNVALALNYLWGLTFCLLFLYIWQYYNNYKLRYTIPLFFVCFLLGLSQELFALPIAGAVCLYYLSIHPNLASRKYE